MRVFICALGLSLLGGCANVADIRANPAVLSLNSTKSAEQVAECIRDGWQSTSIVGGSVGGVLQKSGNSYSVIAPNPETPWHIADIDPATVDASKITYRFHRTWQAPSGKVVDVVKACAR